MKNATVCNNCSSENPQFSLVCSHCGAYLRERVVNIDLFRTLGQLIESPYRAFLSLTHAEHKNFVIYLTLIIALKLAVNGIILKEPLFSYSVLNVGFFNLWLIASAALILLLTLFAFIVRFFLKTASIHTRFRDGYTVLAYSQMPHIFSLIFVFPVEMVLFGAYLFTAEPSPFMIKPGPAWILSGIEVILFIWTVVLSAIAYYTQTGLKLLSILLSIIFNALVAAIVILLAML